MNLSERAVCNRPYCMLCFKRNNSGQPVCIYDHCVIPDSYDKRQKYTEDLHRIQSDPDGKPVYNPSDYTVRSSSSNIERNRKEYYNKPFRFTDLDEPTETPDFRDEFLFCDGKPRMHKRKNRNNEHKKRQN